MPSVCFYLHAHQPLRLKNYSFFDIGKHSLYFDDERNRSYLERIVKKSYLPTNQLLLDLIEKTNGRFKFSLSLTGVLLEQLERFFPEVIESFQALIKTGCVDILAETYYHSLASLYSKIEFQEQVKLHNKKIKELFDFSPKIFRNTELVFSNELAELVGKMGYKAILSEGIEKILGWRSPNFVYQAKNNPEVKLLLRNYRLSDDISFRFSSHGWQEWPLTAEKFALWINQINGNGEIVNLFMDYETFGEHQWQETGIFDFLKELPWRILSHPDNNFKTVSEVVQLYEAKDSLDFPFLVTWADTERDLSAWQGNKMQQVALEKTYALLPFVKQTEDDSLLDQWRKLQTSDHFYYMCTKWFSDGDVHKYFSPYESPYEAFIIFMNVLNDFKIRLS
ncbi:glycoside hydrolase family 57 protein [Candidatus Gribaldobacteria bacterium]|nr:glycoside hydrolase family 57 protein [Candidatus Gribaldobacteria bacterium]